MENITEDIVVVISARLSPVDLLNFGATCYFINKAVSAAVRHGLWTANRKRCPVFLKERTTMLITADGKYLYKEPGRSCIYQFDGSAERPEKFSVKINDGRKTVIYTEKGSQIRQKTTPDSTPSWAAEIDWTPLELISGKNPTRRVNIPSIEENSDSSSEELPRPLVPRKTKTATKSRQMGSKIHINFIYSFHVAAETLSLFFRENS